ncbi:PAS domain S-box protein [Phycicoccus duodecadis]|uniref:PAS domain S-box protein n=1 Tax=Phycicoccus duodecadis TaxID=173053 RepID=UPI00130446ED|nr:PAS domain S-box protein [Phycicoccus duodecadis]
MYGAEGPFDDWASRPGAVASSLTHRLSIAVYVAEPGPVGRWLHVSPAIHEVLGVSPTAILEDPTLWNSLLHPDDREALIGSEVVLEPDTRARTDYRVIRPDGRVVWLLDDAVIGLDAAGRPVMDGYLVDITSQRRAERMMAAQARVVEGLTGRTPLREVLVGLPEACVESASAVACVVEVGDARLVALRSDADSVPRLGATLSADTPLPDSEATGRVTLHYAPGVVPPADDRAVPEWAVGLVSLAATRLAERERAELMTAQLAATLESTVDGILVVDRHDRVVGHNTRFARMWDLDPAVLAAGDTAAVTGAILDRLEDPAAFLAAVQHLAGNPEETSVDELRTRDGRELERYSLPQRIDGHPVGRVWSFRDVTETRRLQAEVREREASLDRLVSQVKDYAILNLDAEGRVASWNEGAARILRHAESAVLGMSYEVFFPDDAPEFGRADRLLQLALTRGSAREEGWFVRRDGERFWAAVVLTALRDDQGRMRGIGLVLQDVSERRTAQLALERRARTLATVGTIATAANSATSIGGALDTALLAVCEHGAWQLAHVYLLDDESGTLRHHAWHVAHDLDPHRFAAFIAATDAISPIDLPLPAAVLEQGRTVWVSDLTVMPATGRAPVGSAAGLVSGSGVPVLVGSERVGVLEFFSTSPRPFDVESDLVMRQLGTQLGRVVERERAERRSAALARSVMRLSGGNPPPA